MTGDWSGNNGGVTPTTLGGFYIELPNNSLSLTQMYFVNLNGDVIWEDTTDIGQTYVEAFSRYVALYYPKDAGYKLAILDDDNFDVRVILFDNYIIGGGFSYDDVHATGFVVREDIGTNSKYWIVPDDSTTPILLKEWDTLSDNVYVYQYAYSTRIVLRTNDSLYQVYNSEDGSLVTEYDLTTAWSTYEFSMLDNNSFVFHGRNNDTSEYWVIFYSGPSDTFYTKELPDYYGIDYDIYDQKNYKSSYDHIAGGNAMYLFRDDEVTSNGDFYYYNDVKILPIWSTDTSIRDFYTFSSLKGIRRDYDDADFAFNRTSDYASILIDNQPSGIYYFSDSGDPNKISDGGDDMYDGGNEIYADDVQVNYTHTQLGEDPDGGVPTASFIMDGIVINAASGSVFGASSSYFTNLYPGLFVMCAQDVSIDKFSIGGYLGADGSGFVDTYDFPISNYQVFTKRVWGAQDPSVNHIIIVNAATSSGITHSISGDTDSDMDEIVGLSASGVTEVYYLLLAFSFGIKIGDFEIKNVTEAFLNIREVSPNINSLLTNLNSNYSNILDPLPIPDTNFSILRFNKDNDPTTLISTDIPKINDDNDDDQINGRIILQEDTDYNIVGGTYGWDDFSNIESRRYSSFRKANNNNIGNYVVGRKLVMKDKVNDEYWAIEFTQWTGGGGGGFAYTRQQIVGGTFSGPVIAFTHSNYGSEVDVISAGVLEITRGEYGPIYNSALESDSNGRNPRGTSWNSQYVYDWTETKHYIVDTEGTINGPLTTENYDNEWYGSIYFIADENFENTHVLNDNTKNFISLGAYYPDYQNSDRNIDGSGIENRNFLIYDGAKNRILTKTTISEEFTIPLTETAAKIDSRRISLNGCLFVILYDSGTKFVFYDLSGNFVAEKNVTGYLSGANLGYSSYDAGNRLWVNYYKYDSDIRYTIVFKGDSIEEIEFTPNGTTYTENVPNDYDSWD